MISAVVAFAGATSISRPVRSSSLGKNQADEEAPLPPQACGSLDRLHQALRPASSNWPVFPTLHRPTLSQTVRAALDDAGYNREEIEAAIDENDWLTLYRTHESVPPVLTTNGGRTVMRRVCDEAEISLDGDHDYLTPHGGRRGAGDVLYCEDPVLAQTALRHRSIETTKDSYSYIEAGETASRSGDIFDANRDSE
jgi:integrase